ncbi:AT hook-like family-containing protein [Strongyloides ratti]|uniref:AT hook-like family-containing protein n=1 Tax=Strongyloides ratti TaxID=34506 RepID=A0A090LH25_STRRB|nr:AT hook-like family-containing protein [Strongyloides ratti]CEF66770.1 AT hook-like family-containing protein [Strongyloides ratti]
MSDNDKISSIGDDLSFNKKDIVKKKRGRPPSKINKDGIKKYKKNNLPQNYLSLCKNNRNGNLKIFKCSQSMTTNLCKNLSTTKVQINSEKKKRGRPRKIPSSTIDIKSPPKFEDSILSLITKNDSENEEDLFIDDIESKTETTLEAQNKLLNLLQKPPSFADYATNIIENNMKQHGKKRGRPRKSDMQNCFSNKMSKVIKNVSDDVIKKNSTILAISKQKDKFSHTKIDEEKSNFNCEQSNKDKLTRKKNSDLPSSNNSEQLNCDQNKITPANTPLPVISENLKNENEKQNTKLSSNESIMESSLLNNQCDINSHLTGKTLSNLFKRDTIVPQIMEKKKRGRPRGSLTSKNKSTDSLLAKNNDNLMEKILGSFSKIIPVKKKRGRPCKINLSQVPANNILPTTDNDEKDNPLNLSHTETQEHDIKKIENVSNTSKSQEVFLLKEEENTEETETFMTKNLSKTDGPNLKCSNAQNIYNNKNNFQNKEGNLAVEQKNSINDTTVVVTLSSDGTYAISGNLPKMPKILICNGVIENSNECIKIPIQLIINNQSGNINSEMTPITLSPENLSRSESLPFGSDSNQINESTTSARNNSFSLNTENHSNITIKKSSSNSCFDDKKDALSTKLIHNESIISSDQGNNLIPCMTKNFISPTSISGLEEEYDDRPEVFKPFMPKSVLPINITSLRDDSLYDRKGRASSLPPLSSPK